MILLARYLLLVIFCSSFEPFSLLKLVWSCPADLGAIAVQELNNLSGFCRMLDSKERDQIHDWHFQSDKYLQIVESNSFDAWQNVFLLRSRTMTLLKSVGGKTPYAIVEQSWWRIFLQNKKKLLVRTVPQLALLRWPLNGAHSRVFAEWMQHP